MKTRDNVSPEKLRGGFYTPAALVAHVLRRVDVLAAGMGPLRVLEPSVGDGRFIDGVTTSTLPVREFVGVEVLPKEAAKAADRLAASGIAGRVVSASTLRWSLGERPDYDAVVGNLPFVRFQFVTAADRAAADVHAAQLGVSIGGVSNLWLPMLLAGLRLLRPDGVFALVLPTECLTGVSAGSARSWLAQNCQELRCDLYPAGSFPGALQEVLVLSGRRVLAGSGDQALTVAQHARSHSSVAFDDSHATLTRHCLDAPERGWTRYLLNPAAAAALEEFQQLSAVARLGAVARFEVATVTGANSYFCMSEDTVEKFELGSFVQPLLSRIRHAPGLVFTPDDYRAARVAGAPCYILDASKITAERATLPGLDAYLRDGEAQRLHTRYKCRIRQPWWAVPYMRSAELSLSKRSHRFHRMVVNEVGAITTDTIYRGTVTVDQLSPAALAAGFHNSGTLLNAEIEGRYFGGGVLELVPSEVARLAVPAVPALGAELGRLDQLTRTATAGPADQLELLVTESDLLLAKADVGVTDEMIEALAAGRDALLQRRLDRGSSGRDEDTPDG